MSHLTILPTVLRDPDLLVVSLTQLGLTPLRGGTLAGFADAPEPVDVQVRLPGGEGLGWQVQTDGSLALIGDLQKISRSHVLQDLIARITRHYAANQAVEQARQSFAPGSVSLSR